MVQKLWKKVYTRQTRMGPSIEDHSAHSSLDHLSRFKTETPCKMLRHAGQMMEWCASIFDHFRINIQHVEGTHPTYRNRLHEHLTLSVLPNRQAYAHAEMGVLTRSSNVGIMLHKHVLQPTLGRGTKSGEGQDLPEMGSQHLVWGTLIHTHVQVCVLYISGSSIFKRVTSPITFSVFFSDMTIVSYTSSG